MYTTRSFIAIRHVREVEAQYQNRSLTWQQHNIFIEKTSIIKNNIAWNEPITLKALQG